MAIGLLPTLLILIAGTVPEKWVYVIFWVVMAPLFFGCGHYAIIPWWKKDAPYRFCLVVGVCWLLGAIPGVLILVGIRAIFHR